jgi:hypothetical protein
VLDERDLKIMGIYEAAAYIFQSKPMMIEIIL